MQTVDCSGKQVVKAPTWSGNVGLRHLTTFGDGGTLELEARTKFSSSYWGAVDFIPNERQGSYTMTSLQATYTVVGGRWRVTAYVHNLENSDVATSSFQAPFVPGVVYGALLPPRTYGARLSFNF